MSTIVVWDEQRHPADQGVTAGIPTDVKCTGLDPVVNSAAADCHKGTGLIYGQHFGHLIAVGTIGHPHYNLLSIGTLGAPASNGWSLLPIS